MIATLVGNPVPLLAVVTGAAAAGIAGYLLLAPGQVRIPVERRRPGQDPTPGVLERTTGAVTAVIGRAMRRRGTPVGASTFDLAGVRMRPQDFVFLLIVGSLAGVALGALLGSVLLAVVLAVAWPLGGRIVLGRRIARRQKQFAEQLDDSLQLMASNLRAGHSLPQALASVAREADNPTAEEFARVVNETRVGRDLGDALSITAARMASEDFSWVTQAIAINREVGGNLAEVLDGVANTIRQRGEIRRQVAALSAEGRLSAVVLMILPFGVGGFLLLTNPGYLAPFTESIIGYAMLVVGAILLVAGGLWLNKTVSIEF